MKTPRRRKRFRKLMRALPECLDKPLPEPPEPPPTAEPSASEVQPEFTSRWAQADTFRIDSTPHVSLRNAADCREECIGRPCTFLCPSEVFEWREKDGGMLVRYWQCVECGACRLFCDNVQYEHPRGGCGLIHYYG